jgi:hypothetical protein
MLTRTKSPVFLILRTGLAAVLVTGLLWSCSTSQDLQASQSPDGKTADQRKSDRIAEVNGSDLIREISRALSLIAKSRTEDSADQTLQNEAAQPFFQAVAAIDKPLTGLWLAVSRNDQNLYQAISQVTRAIEAVKITYRYTEIRNPQVLASLNTLVGGWTAFQDRYGQGIANLKSNTTQVLPDPQKDQIKQLQTQNSELIKRLDALKTKAEGQETLTRDIELMLVESQRIQSAPATVVGLMTVLNTIDRLVGQYAGLYAYVNQAHPDVASDLKDWDAYWQNVDAVLYPAYSYYYSDFSWAYFKQPFTIAKGVLLDKSESELADLDDNRTKYMTALAAIVPLSPILTAATVGPAAPAEAIASPAPQAQAVAQPAPQPAAPTADSGYETAADPGIDSAAEDQGADAYTEPDSEAASDYSDPADSGSSSDYSDDSGSGDSAGYSEDSSDDSSNYSDDSGSGDASYSDSNDSESSDYSDDNYDSGDSADYSDGNSDGNDGNDDSYDSSGDSSSNDYAEPDNGSETDQGSY